MLAAPFHPEVPVTDKSEKEFVSLSHSQSRISLPRGIAAMISRTSVSHCSTDNSPDFCYRCFAIGSCGRVGHIPWDEVEMKRHGWTNRQGSHWTQSHPRDEVELLKSGMVNTKGQRKPCSDAERHHLTLVTDAEPLLSKKVSFGQTTETAIDRSPSNASLNNSFTSGSDDSLFASQGWDNLEMLTYSSSSEIEL